VAEERLAETQIPLDRADGNGERGGNLVAAHPAKIAHFDNTCFALVHFGELVEGVAHFEHVWNAAVCRQGRVVECDHMGRTTAFVRAPRARAIHKNEAHEPSRDPEEVGAVVPLGRAGLVDEAYPCFVDQLVGLKVLMAEIALQIGSGKRLEFAVHPRRELLESISISLRPPAEEERQGAVFHQKYFGTVRENTFEDGLLAVMSGFCEGVQ
jgi:hypothetical protein